jgi:hypothetical protein
MTTPSIFDELVRARAWPLGEASATMVEAVVCAVIEPGSRASIAEPADWSGVQRPPAAGQSDG